MLKKRLGRMVLVSFMGFGTMPLVQAKENPHSKRLIGCTPKQTICAIRTSTGMIGDRVTFHIPVDSKTGKKIKRAPLAKGVIISIQGDKGSEQKALVRIQWGQGEIPHKAIPLPPKTPVSSWKSSFSQND